MNNRKMRVAVEGCCHGELDKIYQSISEKNCDLLIICGDFQSIRNQHDLDCTSVPEKFKQLGGFHKYYSGERKAPVLTIFIGGNHEASNYLFELFHGGWVCPNIYYLGASGCVNFGGLRIAGLSGIFKGHDYDKGFFERHPIQGGDLRSIYHIRSTSVYKLAQLKEKVDIFLSHDWPLGIVNHGNIKGLLKYKSFLEKEIRENTLGSPPGEFLLKRLKPSYWFAAHLHVKFEATFEHELELPKVLKFIPIFKNPDEIQLDSSDEEEEEEETAIPIPVVAAAAEQPIQLPKKTKFLALDKCLPNRKFLEIIDMDVLVKDGGDPAAPFVLSLDPEWLSILRATESLLTFTRSSPSLPTDEHIQNVIEIERIWVDAQGPGILVPPAFCRTAGSHGEEGADRAVIFSNPQTEDLRSFNLGLEEGPSHINGRGIRISKEDQELSRAKSRLLHQLNA